MLIPLALVDDVAIVDLAQQHPRTHNNMLQPVYVLFDSRTLSHNHHPTTSTPPPWSVMDQPLLPNIHSHNHNNVPTRLMSHNRNNVSSRFMSRNNVSSRFMSRNNVSSRFTSSTVSVVDETLVYGSSMPNNIPRTRNHQIGHPRHHNNGTRASSSTVIGAPSAAVVMGAQDSSTTDAESICCICLVHLSSGSSMPIRLRCSHLFHSDCIQKWVNIRQTCPLCRADV